MRDAGSYPLLQINGCFVVGALSAAALHKQLSAVAKSFLIVGLVMVLGLADVYHLGMIGAGYWWCLQSSIFAVAFYSLRVALAVTAAYLTAIAAIGFGFVAGRLNMPVGLDGYVECASAWGGFLTVVVFAPLPLMVVFSNYQKTIARLIDEINGQRGELARRVGHDPLTGFPQSSVAADRLDVALQRARRRGAKVALLFVDLDGFKSINDGHGHAAGDHLLQQLAERLTAWVRAQDLVARVGGDEFIVILTDVADDAAASRFAQLITEEAARAVAW